MDYYPLVYFCVLRVTIYETDMDERRILIFGRLNLKLIDFNNR